MGRFGLARTILAVLGLAGAFALGILVFGQERPLIAPGLAGQMKRSAPDALPGPSPVANDKVTEATAAETQPPFAANEPTTGVDPTLPRPLGSRTLASQALRETPAAATPQPTPQPARAENTGDGRQSFEWIDLLEREAAAELGETEELSGLEPDPRSAPQAARAEPLSAAEDAAAAGASDLSPRETASDAGPGADLLPPRNAIGTTPSPPEFGPEAPRALIGPPLPGLAETAGETTEARSAASEPQPLLPRTAERIIDLPDPPTDPTAGPDAVPGVVPPPAFEPSTDRPIEIPDAPKTRLALPAGKGQLVRLGQLIDKVLLADPAIADVHVVSPRLIYVFGSQVGGTDLFALAANGDIVASLDLEVLPDAERAQEGLVARYPGSDVTLDALGGRVVARGQVENLDEAYDVAALAQGLAPPGIPPSNRTTITGSQQVNLRVRFAEIRRNDIYRLGINWQALIERGDFLIGLATGNFAFPGSAIGSGSSIGNETFGTAFGSFDSGSVDLDVVIDALQREGVVSILAEPNLTAMNGEPASFLAGGEFPFPVPSGDGDVTIEFKEFGVSLNFLPTLIADDRIAIQVRPEVSQINFGSGFAVDGFVVPLLTVRRTQTTVELNSGQTFALAGLFQRSISDDLDKFPFLGDIPILGKLFQSVRYQQEETGAGHPDHALSREARLRAEHRPARRRAGPGAAAATEAAEKPGRRPDRVHHRLRG